VPRDPTKVSVTVVRMGPVPFSTPFRAEIINAPCYGKNKMPTMDLYDGATNSEEHLGVYKTQMYVQDVDDVTYCQFLPATLKGVAHFWFNGLVPGSISCFQDLADRFVSQFITSGMERRTSIHLSKINRGCKSPRLCQAFPSRGGLDPRPGGRGGVHFILEQLKVRTVQVLFSRAEGDHFSEGTEESRRLHPSHRDL